MFRLLADPAYRLHVPDLFYPECANILWKHAQRGTISAVQAAADFANLVALPLDRIPVADLASEALSLALAHAITAYDACYVALSNRLHEPLITADQRLVNKLAGTGLAVSWLGAWVAPAPPP